MRYIIVFIIFLSSCSQGNLKIQIDSNYQGPVAVIECYNKKNNFETIQIDSIGIGICQMDSDKTLIQVVDEYGARLETYSSNQKGRSKNKKMVFTLGKSTLTGYCNNEDIDYIYFYVGTYDSYQAFSSEYKGDELLFFEKKNIEFCDYVNNCR